jgi:hypothetical protein
MDYMAHSEKIKPESVKTLAVFDADENLAAVKNLLMFIPKKTREELCVDTIIGYYTNLKSAIEKTI